MDNNLLHLQMQFNLALTEAAQSQLRARHFEQRVVTGAYRERLGKAFIGGLPEHGGVPMTEDELRQSDLATMHRHITLAEEHIEHAKGLLARHGNSLAPKKGFDA